jgi:hypothetical protein
MRGATLASRSTRPSLLCSWSMVKTQLWACSGCCEQFSGRCGGTGLEMGR